MSLKSLGNNPIEATLVSVKAESVDRRRTDSIWPMWLNDEAIHRKLILRWELDFPNEITCSLPTIAVYSLSGHIFRDAGYSLFRNERS